MTIPVTESLNTASKGIDEKTVEEILLIINEEDGKIPDIIKGEIPRIGSAVGVVVETLREGGNVFLIGSGTSGRLAISEAAEIPPTFSLSPDRFQGILAGGADAFMRAVEGAEDSPEAGSTALLEKGMDEKILCVPVSDPMWNHVKTLEDIPPHMMKEIEHFFNVYKELEDKETIMIGWEDVTSAWEIIDAAIERFEEEDPSSDSDRSSYGRSGTRSNLVGQRTTALF